MNLTDDYMTEKVVYFYLDFLWKTPSFIENYLQIAKFSSK